MDNCKYALLDTDFIIKTIIAKKDDNQHLLDLLLNNNSFTYVCHEITLKELSIHDTCGAFSWLEKAIFDNKIKIFSDKDIIEILCLNFGDAGIYFYKKFLKESCDTISPNAYLNYYREIENFDIKYGKINFLITLLDCDKKVGKKNNLGEEKIVILLQVLRYFYPNKVYMFCSDDRKARTGMLSISNIPCKSVMSIFWDMHKNGFSKDDAFKYFLPLKKYLTKDGQTLGNIRVYDKKMC